jgi:hypothetical protein
MKKLILAALGLVAFVGTAQANDGWYIYSFKGDACVSSRDVVAETGASSAITPESFYKGLRAVGHSAQYQAYRLDDGSVWSVAVTFGDNMVSYFTERHYCEVFREQMKKLGHAN